MRAAIRWSIAIIGTLAAFGLVTWLSALAGADESWALGLGALAAALVLAGLQTWATSRHRSRDNQRPAAETHINKIDSPDIDGSVVQADQVRDIYINTPPAGSPEAASARLEPKYPIRVGDVPQRPPAFQPRTDLFEQIAAAERVAVVQALTGARGVGKTQLAAEYAQRCIANDWQLVAWIPAEEPGQALTRLTELAEKLGPGPPRSRPPRRHSAGDAHHRHQPAQ